jgi:putative transposase
MCNHVHLILVPQDEKSLSLVMQSAHGNYATYLNKKYCLVGHAWQARFKSVPMDESHLYNAIRYVERNPVKAALVDRAENYRWSSAAAHCGLREDPLLIGACPVTTEIPQWSIWINGPTLDNEDELIRRHTSSGKPLGSDEFIHQLELKTGRSLKPQPVGRPKQKS